MSIPPAIYLYRDPVDFRKAVNGLALIVEQQMELSPFSEALFVFCNKVGDIKVLCPKNYLQGFNGYLQVDGYAAYEQTEATLVGCFAHAWRKFTEAKKAQPKGKSDKADMALAMIQKLYRIETEIKHKTAQEKWQVR